MTKQKLYQFTIFILILVIGMMGSYFFGQQRSLAQTFFGKPLIQESVPLAFSVADPANPLSFFTDYATWPSSSTPKQNDYMKHVLTYMEFSTPSTSNFTHTFVDVNGDGLVDFLHSGNDGQRMVVFLNNGNNNFTVGYKCYVSDKWYGDCAQL